MSLLYIWVENYECFQNQEFNFSTKHHFHFDKENKTLFHDLRDQRAEDFFGETIELYAVVGDNGAGKTTVWKMLSEYVFSDRFFNFGDSVIVAFEDKNKIAIICSYFTKSGQYSEENLPIKNFKSTYQEEDFNKYFTALTVDGSVSALPIRFTYENEGGRQGNPGQILLRKTKNIFISNIFDSAVIDTPYMLNHIDLSTNYLLNKYETDGTIEHPLNAYWSNEFLKQIESISFYENKQTDINKTIPFELPYSAVVSSVDMNHLMDLILERVRLFGSHDYEDTMRKAMGLFTRSSIDDSKEHNWYSFMRDINFGIRTIFINQIFTNRDVKDKELEKIFQTLKVEKNSFQDGINAPSRDSNFSLRIFDIFAKEGLLGKIGNSLKDFLEWIICNKENIQPFLSTGNGVNPVLTYHLKETTNLAKFIEIYSKIKPYGEIFDFRWNRPLSSGEQVLLTMYARFYDAVKECKKSMDGEIIEGIFIFWDEIDLNLHPAWQQEIVKNFVRFLPDIFTNQKIQLIFSTLSPIVLSDIPKSNVIFLKTKDRKTSVIPSDAHEETFAANISTLFYDSFVLQKGSIGCFAKSKIENIIDEINKPRNHSSEELPYKELEKEISMIGEPLIKQKLLEMLDEAFFSEEREVRKLEEERF